MSRIFSVIPRMDSTWRRLAITILKERFSPSACGMEKLVTCSERSAWITWSKTPRTCAASGPSTSSRRCPASSPGATPNNCSDEGLAYRMTPSSSQMAIMSLDLRTSSVRRSSKRRVATSRCRPTTSRVANACPATTSSVATTSTHTSNGDWPVARLSRSSSSAMVPTMRATMGSEPRRSPCRPDVELPELIAHGGEHADVEHEVGDIAGASDHVGSAQLGVDPQEVGHQCDHHGDQQPDDRPLGSPIGDLHGEHGTGDHRDRIADAVTDHRPVLQKFGARQRRNGCKRGEPQQRSESDCNGREVDQRARSVHATAEVEIE